MKLSRLGIPWKRKTKAKRSNWGLIVLGPQNKTVKLWYLKKLMPSC